MEAIREQLNAQGVDTTSMNDETVRNVAKALKLSLPREVQIVDYKGARYVKTENFAVPSRPGQEKAGSARSLFLRVEAIDQAIADLTAAKGLLTK